MDIPEGWIKHNGIRCPVPLDSRPGVMGFARNSSKPYWYEPGLIAASEHDWRHRGKATDIIAYKPEQANG